MPRDGSVVSSLHCMNDPQPEGHMASYIGRRKFLASLGGTAVAWPLAASAQQGGRGRRIAALMSMAADDPEAQPRVAAFESGLRELGREVVPGLGRLAIMGNVGNPLSVLELGEVQAAARQFGLQYDTLEIRRPQDIASALGA